MRQLVHVWGFRGSIDANLGIRLTVKKIPGNTACFTHRIIAVPTHVIFTALFVVGKLCTLLLLLLLLLGLRLDGRRWGPRSIVSHV